MRVQLVFVTLALAYCLTVSQVSMSRAPHETLILFRSDGDG